MNIVTLLPFIVLIGAMFLMTRSAKNKQRQAAKMRDAMTPGTGVRTIGGMYATVKEIRDDTVLLEVAPGTHALYAKNAVGAVLEQEEYERIVNGTSGELGIGETVVPDDASSLTSDDDADGSKVDFAKEDGADSSSAEDATTAADAKDEQTKGDDRPEDAKRKGTDSE
ncbi:preprotein translocase subunit YajC [Streptomyces sp. WMMB 322]|uniref:preprotein translocase subunit YajC n=1 Tax=Streptomyces sp. WMMB 322 TaxID=1286821 RepID=UPI0006E3DE90|nr:preprotein translocase subunit YajC [Streptomyces sp. WMMB 322]SCK43834.1 preprotein translocase subunit YajC [Streptomyces sp. WMMB 322]